VQRITAGVIVQLASSATFERPRVAGRIGEIGPQSSSDLPDARTAQSVRGTERLDCIGSPKGSQHGRGILDLTPGNEVLQQGEAGIVERDVGRALRMSPRKSEHAGQSRRKEEWAHWCRHHRET
jgi:hypothetical protein